MAKELCAVENAHGHLKMASQSPLVFSNRIPSVDSKVVVFRTQDAFLAPPQRSSGKRLLFFFAIKRLVFYCCTETV